MIAEPVIRFSDVIEREIGELVSSLITNEGPMELYRLLVITELVIALSEHQARRRFITEVPSHPREFFECCAGDFVFAAVIAFHRRFKVTLNVDAVEACLCRHAGRTGG